VDVGTGEEVDEGATVGSGAAVEAGNNASPPSLPHAPLASDNVATATQAILQPPVIRA
jgi:hypothetical protein